jgi:UDP-glucose 6-dehydrogenase
MQLHEVAEYWNEILKLDEFQSRRFCDNIVDTMVTIKGKKIAILGFAYKPDTSDTRESPAIAICNSLIAEGCKIAICDPQVCFRSRIALSLHSLSAKALFFAMLRGFGRHVYPHASRTSLVLALVSFL